MSTGFDNPAVQALIQSLDGRAFINGQRVAALSGQVFDCVSPIDGRVLTPVAR